jgi:hypothetical protein
MDGSIGIIIGLKTAVYVHAFGGVLGPALSAWHYHATSRDRDEVQRIFVIWLVCCCQSVCQPTTN